MNQPTPSPDNLFADAASQLLDAECTPDVVRAIEADGAAGPLWAHLADAGFGDALIPEDQGGAGLGFADVFAVWAIAGSHALPVPLGETMLARALLARAGHAQPPGRLSLAEGRRDGVDGALHAPRVSLARVTDSVLVQHAAGWQCLPVAAAELSPAPFVLDARLSWPAATLRDTPLLDPKLPAELDARALLAALFAAQLSGALTTTFERTLAYANERQQFGRPIGKFQAIQHQLAVMSEHVFAARTAAQLGCTPHAGRDGGLPDPLRVAVAKARTSQAAVVVAELAHSIHGAIGFTAEFDLQLLTRRLHTWRQAAGSESWWQAVAGRALVDQHQGLSLDLLRSTTDLGVT